MSEIKNGRLGLDGTEHSKCNHLITLGFKGLETTLTDKHTNRQAQTALK